MVNVVLILDTFFVFQSLDGAWTANNSIYFSINFNLKSPETSRIESEQNKLDQLCASAIRWPGLRKVVSRKHRIYFCDQFRRCSHAQHRTGGWRADVNGLCADDSERNYVHSLLQALCKWSFKRDLHRRLKRKWVNILSDQGPVECPSKQTRVDRLLQQTADVSFFRCVLRNFISAVTHCTQPHVMWCKHHVRLNERLRSFVVC